MGMIVIKNIEFGGDPRVVGIIDSPMTTMRLVNYVERGVDMFEVRVDLFDRAIGKVVEYIEMIKGTISVPLIGTVRETDLNSADRADWYVSLAKCVDIVDIELGMPKWREAVDGVLGSAVIMVSEHDFNATPDVNGLDDIVRRSVDQGAEIVKIATMANCAEDVTRLLRFTEDCEVPVVSIAMGDIGFVSRVVAPLFGSLFTYGYLGRKPLAPGQISALELVGALNLYFPKRKAGVLLNRAGLK
jgi:3-dehydroquinate dehydratase-1